MSRKTVSIAALIFSLIGLSGSCRKGPASGRASVRESPEAILTYPFGDPDPVPIFARSSMWGQGSRLYPYFSFDGYSASGQDKEWTVVRLENPYLEVAVLPQAGGKVWGAREKATGREFLYWNHVLKFRQIALRGPWTSGGIEFNFGIVGHAPSTATPVDYLVRRNPDGGVKCVVGTMDLPSRTRWSVTITLPRDAAAFETNALWVNPTPFSQSYYAWSCAAVKTADDLRYIFPGRWFIGHDYSVPLEPWPLDRQGRDLSRYAVNAFPGSKSYFTVGEHEDFYGGWYEKSDTGFGHWSRYEDMPGRKVWIWDLSRSGGIWVDLLTDHDGQYTEPQAGRLLNQSDHGDFPPASADRWQEIWFPYRGIGPMAKASPAAVLGAARNGDVLSLGLFALQPVEDDLIVSASGRDLWRGRVTLVPQKLWKKDISVAGVPGEYEVRLGDKLVYKSEPSANDLERPLKFRSPAGGTAEAMFLEGRGLEKERRYPEALEKYLACIGQEALHVRALSRAAELCVRRGEAEKGLAFAGRALEVSMYDPEANYVYGIAARRTGRTVDARETLGWAARSPQFRSTASVQLAEMAIRDREFRRAAELAVQAIEADGTNISAREVLATAHRLAGRKREARRVLDEIAALDPLDHQARFEVYLLTGRLNDLESFRSLIRSELPHETYLEIAVYYSRLGLAEDAVLALRQAPEQPTVLAWLAWLLKDKSPAESSACLEKAMGLSTRLVFPFREESIAVFSWALAARPADWKPKYYLGLIYWGKGRVDEARDLFAMCDNADEWPFFAARGSLVELSDPDAALANYRKAFELDPSGWRPRHILVGFYLRRGRNAEALEAAGEAVRAFPGEGPLKVDLVRSLIAVKRFAEAATVLDGIEALPYEGASEIHGLYVQTHVALGLENMRKGDWRAAGDEFEKSKLYPERLGTGEPFHPDFRLQDYLSALCFDRLGEKAKAEAMRKAIYEYTLAYWDEGQPHSYFGGLVLQREGRREDRLKARELLARGLPSPEILAILRALD